MLPLPINFPLSLIHRGSKNDDQHVSLTQLASFKARGFLFKPWPATGAG